MTPEEVQAAYLHAWHAAYEDARESLRGLDSVVPSRLGLTGLDANGKSLFADQLVRDILVVVREELDRYFAHAGQAKIKPPPG